VIARSKFQRLLRRALFSLLIITVVLLVGTVGMNYLEGWRYVDSFYFTSMLVTAEGPPNAPATDAGKIFASLMAFVGVGSVVTAFVYLLGPVLGTLLRKGVSGVEKEIRAVEREIEGKKDEP